MLNCLKIFLGCDILDVSEYLGGKIFKTILGILFFSYFVTSSSILLRELAEALKIIYYPITNVFFIILLFIITIGITSRLEFTSTIKAASLIIPIVVFSSLFLFTANFRNFSTSRIFPILGEGFVNTFIIGLGNISSFAGIVILYFLPPLLKKPEDLKKISISSVIIFFLYLILNIAAILFMFSSFMSENEVLTLYTASRYIQIGSFFVRLESIFLLIWISVFACYLANAVKFSMLVLQKTTKIKNSKIFSYSICILMFAISLIPKTYAQAVGYESYTSKFVILGFSYCFCILLLVFANLKKKKQKKVGGQYN